MDENQVYKQLDRIKDIPTLPTIVFELNQHLQNSDVGIHAAVVASSNEGRRRATDREVTKGILQKR